MTNPNPPTPAWKRQFDPLSGAATEVLWCLFALGPTEDGNLPSKSGRDDLFDKGMIDRADGWQWLTRTGVMLALGLGFDRKKEQAQRERRIPR
ncbi:hypothetical protein [Sphingomonas immobilis]|uniref:Uncharacterized protein n=1 Tax=Sphingomonas immobilis TaxID=3063997 RepID=A0ABT8ZU70_9SPHN|nr:hypothetical protein [Sphingomonas sp. CA1-15]MDO7841120.1 hypothetical protein [Sphingomonas sp. CA1-15]